VRRRFRPLSRREIWAGAVEHVIAFATGDPTVSSDGMAIPRVRTRRVDTAPPGVLPELLPACRGPQAQTTAATRLWFGPKMTKEEA
jgi:hypothetical protein